MPLAQSQIRKVCDIRPWEGIGALGLRFPYTRPVALKNV